MIHNIFSVYDNKAEAFLPPFVLPKREMAIRTFADSINNRRVPSCFYTQVTIPYSDSEDSILK